MAERSENDWPVEMTQRFFSSFRSLDDSPKSRRTFWTLVISAVAVATLLRFAVVSAKFGWDTVPDFGDGVTYIVIAKEIRATGSVLNHNFPVGYPIYVAVVGSLGMVRAGQVLLGVLTVICIGRLAFILYGRGACIVAMWFACLYPGLLYMTGRVMSETLYIFLLCLALMLWAEWDRSRRYGLCLAAAVVFGLSCLVRSNLLLVTAWIPFWIIRSTTWFRGLKLSLLPSLILAVVILLPGAYFLQTQGHFSPFATNAGTTFYGANNRLVDGGWVKFDEHPELLEGIPPEARDSPTDFSRALYELGFQWIRENPVDFLVLLPKKFANAWIPGMQQSKVTTQNRWLALVNNLTFGSVVILGLTGMFWARPPQSRDGLLPAVLIVYTLMSLIFYGNPRIGLFCVPILIVYSSGLLARLVLRRSSETRQPKTSSSIG